MFQRFAVLFMLLAAVGCTHYDYDIVDPPDAARHVGPDQWVDVPFPPLVYHFITEDNYLICRIENSSDAAIQLLGDRSVVVSPDGQSHPLRSETIAGHSFIKLVFPPLQPRIERYGPSIGFGVGYRADARTCSEPSYLDLYVDDAPYYWSFHGEGTFRITFVFRSDQRTIEQHFTIGRQKR